MESKNTKINNYKDMDKKDEILGKKIRTDDSEYRFKRVLEIFLEADLKRLQELCQDDKENKMPKLKK
ncbi:MAG: hypothetical protein PHO59_01640 [Candidatus Omnitrophica bacterium]|jgi:hypothetical protein|nr:hypothetical protein [Candidatus Omnitrophota bacterium]